MATLALYEDKMDNYKELYGMIVRCPVTGNIAKIVDGTEFGEPPDAGFVYFKDIVTGEQSSFAGWNWVMEHLGKLRIKNKMENTEKQLIDVIEKYEKREITKFELLSKLFLLIEMEALDRAKELFKLTYDVPSLLIDKNGVSTINERKSNRKTSVNGRKK